MDAPRCFISYSWDSEPHRDWVRKLATRLREQGVDAILDQFHCAPGMDLTKFMEESLRESSFVLLVCTPNFAQKADAGVGGVGYEKAIVTGEIFAGEAREAKFVPLLREGDAKGSLPSYLKSRLFVDFREDAFFERKLEELLRHFYDKPLYPAPPIGPRPRFGTKAPTAVTPEKRVPQQTMTNSIGMDFVLMPAGSFMMGSRMSPKEIVARFGGEEKWYKPEQPRRTVKIQSRFYLQTTPVTQGQWQRVMEDNPSEFKDSVEDCPVEQVSWEDAQRFIEKLNGLEKTKVYRLPTEAEWEWACRAGTNTHFYTGDTEKDLDQAGWYTNNSGGRTHPVKEKKPNTWGLYDMHGNVWEWVEDDWHNSYKGAPDGGRAWIDSPRGSYHVMRGGSWGDDALDCRSARRNGCWPGDRSIDVGFRLSRSVSLGR